MAKKIYISNDVIFDKSALGIVIEKKSLTNINVTKKSAKGCYYSENIDISKSGYSVFNVTIYDWGECSAALTPTFKDTSLSFMSDISQTAGSLVLKVTYIAN